MIFIARLAYDAKREELSKSKKILCHSVDQTNVKNIYAIGDVVQDMLELTPVAIAGNTHTINKQSEQKRSLKHL